MAIALLGYAVMAHIHHTAAVASALVQNTLWHYPRFGGVCGSQLNTLHIMTVPPRHLLGIVASIEAILPLTREAIL